MDRNSFIHIILLFTCVLTITVGDEGMRVLLGEDETPSGSRASSFSSSPSGDTLIPMGEGGGAVAHMVAFPGRISATEPYIDRATPLFVKAYAGIPAVIRCLVNNLGQRSVSWVRHHDIHVLTVGRFTFTNDDRFEVQHDDGSNEWALKLRAPTPNDSGTYECQINTKPTISQLITLEVLETKAEITAGSELYLDRGSTLRLTCTVVNAPSTSDFLLWYHQEKVANYEMDQVSVSVEANNSTTTSTLTLVDAQPANSGTYTCSPSNAKAASVRVHVLSGEHPAAMQTNGASFCGRCQGKPLYDSLLRILKQSNAWHHLLIPPIFCIPLGGILILLSYFHFVHSSKITELVYLATFFIISNIVCQ